jgi:hypothetical protein
MRIDNELSIRAFKESSFECLAFWGDLLRKHASIGAEATSHPSIGQIYKQINKIFGLRVLVLNHLGRDPAQVITSWMIISSFRTKWRALEVDTRVLPELSIRKQLPNSSDGSRSACDVVDDVQRSDTTGHGDGALVEVELSRIIDDKRRVGKDRSGCLSCWHCSAQRNLVALGFRSTLAGRGGRNGYPAVDCAIAGRLGLTLPHDTERD